MRLGAFDTAGFEARVLELKLVVFDFDGVFTDNSVYVFEDGREAVRCTRFDGIGLDRLRRTGVDLIVLSTETNAVVASRSRKLKLTCIHGSTDKLRDLQALLAERGIGMHEVGFVGNDVNDLTCLRRVGLPIIVDDAHPDIRNPDFSRSTRPGGHGAVREICDTLAAIRERRMTTTTDRI